MELVTPDDGSKLFKYRIWGSSICIVWMRTEDKQEVGLVGFASRVVGAQFIYMNKLAVKCFQRVVFEMVCERL
jgi:hypothetical protein